MRRLATPQDSEAVFSIYTHEQVVPFLTYEPILLDEFKGVYEELLASGCFYVWEVDGTVAGFYKATRHRGRAQHVALLGTPQRLVRTLALGVRAQMDLEKRDENGTDR